MNIISETDPTITYLLKLMSEEHILSLTETMDMGSLVTSVKEKTDELGRKIIRSVIEILDQSLVESENRKKDWNIQRRNQPKTIATLLGPIQYKRTYFKNRQTKEYSHLVDDRINVMPHQRTGQELQVQLLKHAKELSYQKTVNLFEYTGIHSRTSVMNYVHRQGMIESSECPLPEKRAVKRIYIEADEDHVATQHQGNQELRLIYVHEGHVKIGKNRNKLINRRYFTGFYKGRPDELWYEVLTYLNETYDLDQVEEISLSGDGANWIKTGVGIIPKSKFYLDRFHLEKYLKKIANPIDSINQTKGTYYWKLKDALSWNDKKEMKILLDSYLGHDVTLSQEKSIEDGRKYILNNWAGIQNMLQTGYIGCSAEGHISHVLSSRLSSRPLGWSLKGAENVARLRVFGLNGGSFENYYRNKAKEKRKEKRMIKLEKRIIKKVTKYAVTEGRINYATPSFGWYKSM
jgi:hypothetical protein